ncbi:MAG: hypothetical protein U0992_16825 [Planctomycetaceae bacterium]
MARFAMRTFPDCWRTAPVLLASPGRPSPRAVDQRSSKFSAVPTSSCIVPDSTSAQPEHDGLKRLNLNLKNQLRQTAVARGACLHCISDGDLLPRFWQWQPLTSTASITWNAVVSSQKLSVKRPRIDSEIARHQGRLNAILTDQRADYRQPDSAVLALLVGCHKGDCLIRLGLNDL